MQEASHDKIPPQGEQMFITHKMLSNNYCQNRCLSSKGSPFDPTLLQFGESQSVSEHQIHHISHFRAHEPRVELIPRRNSQLRRLRLRKSKQKRKNKTKQNLKLLFFRRNHGVSQPKTLTEALPLFPNATRLSGGEKKKQQTTTRTVSEKKKLKLYPNQIPTTCFSTLPEMI
jgi:hypothetical protein